MRRDLFNRFGVLLISALFICIIFSNLFAAEVNSATTTLLETAKKAWEAGDLETSGYLYRKIITDSPSTIEAIIAYQDLAIQGIQSKRSADVESFVETLKVKYAKFPETADALHSIAQHYQWNDLLEQAINLYRYNSYTYANTKKGMWSQGSIVHYYIEHKDFANAQKEMEVMIERFKDQPTLPQEIHQFAEKYRTTGELDRSLELHRFNTIYSPISSVYTMWSQGALVHHYIRQKDFVSAKQACDTMIERFSEQPTLPQELHLIAEMYKGAGMIDMALELHQYNASHSPITSKYTMQSQGALVHYYIEQKDFYPADYEYKDLLNRFKDQPTLPEEIYQFALKYNSAGETEKALELHRYNATYSPASSLHAMWSQGSIVHYYIEHKDFINAQKEYEVMLDRFKDQENLAKEIYQFALKYNDIGEIGKGLELHQYNVTYSPVSSLYAMQSQRSIVYYYIEHKDFVGAQKEYEIMLSRYEDQSTLPQEIYQFALKYQSVGETEKALELHRYNTTYSPVSLLHTMWSQGALVHYFIENKDFENAQKEYELLLNRFASQKTISQEICHVADKYQKMGEQERARNVCRYGLTTHPDSPWKHDIQAVIVKSYLAEKNYEQAMLASAELLSTCSSRSDTVKYLTELGLIYREEKKWAESLQYYQMALDKAEIPEEELDGYAGIAMASVWLDDSLKAQDIVDLILSDYANEKKTAYSVFMIGEQYYFHAKELFKIDKTVSKEKYSNAIAIWEKNINQLSDTHFQCMAYYGTGLCYRDTEDYKKAADFLQKAYQVNPKFTYADYCLFENIRCYGKMAKSGKITRCEAFYNSYLFLEKLLEQFPNSKYCSYGQAWLSPCVSE